MMTRNNKYIVIFLALIIIAAPILASAQAGEGDPFNMVKNWESGGGIIAALVSIVFGGVFDLTGIVTGAAGKLLDWSIEYSVEISAFYKSGIVLNGWNLCRNVANLGFVFILIFIGIATILQLQTYSYKRLLVGVIVAALLVNFSMSITIMVIDASNVLAMEFLCKATMGSCHAKDISAAISSGIGYGTITGTTVQRNLDKGSNVIKPMMVYSFGSILLLIVAFVLGATAFLFLTRTIVLMFLIIFSPLAFVAMAIKSGLGTKWWRTLFNQAFFAPISLFFLYLVTDFFNTGFKDIVNPAVGGQRPGFYDLITDPGVGNSAIMAQFVIACVLVISSLVVSKQMGAYGASGVINLGNRWRKAATGYAGRISRRVAVKTSGETAQKAAESEKMQRMANMPVFGKATRPLTLALSKIAKEKKKGDSAKVKSYVSLAPGSLASVLPTLSVGMREQVFSKANTDQLEKTVAKMDKKIVQDVGKSIKNDQVRNKFARATNDLEAGSKIHHKMDTVTKEQVGEYYDTLKGGDVGKLKFKNIDVKNKAVVEGLMSKIHTNDLKNSLKTRENIMNVSGTLNAWMASQGKSTDMLADEIEKLGNQETAKYFRNSPGKKLLTKPEEVIISKKKEEKKEKGEKEGEKEEKK